ncbi:hypothetical protein ACFY4B_41975 [Kitasatospora sp. NPDC001261]|uniref:hypothetical protein n=1 Tax=Kitasatospora sp. NPDC001261 TaxID=3364012 RepID=UPI0036B642ED
MSDEGELLRCMWCHEEFRRPSPIGRTPRYCKPSHRQRAKEGRKTDRAVSAAITRVTAGPASISARPETKGGRKGGAVPVAEEPLALW